ncbi:MAG: DNA polymerase III subunit beta [Halothiobacillaceae bacterium]|nr:DNA polymerase III subunit beta [Halothiobacillaceae bacterium]
MKLSLTRESLLTALQQVIGAVERRQTMQILGNVLMHAEGERLRLTGTDLEIELVAETSCGIAVPGHTTVNARKLMDIIKAVPEGCEIKLSADAGRLDIQAERSRFKLSTLPAEEFPSVPDLVEPMRYRLAQNTLRRLIERVAFSMAQQDVRYYLNGLLLEMGTDYLRCVTTDGHRLALSETPAQIGGEGTRQIIVPRKAIMELLRLLETVDSEAELAIDANHLRIDIPGLRFTTKLIDGRFPDYHRVIPDNGPNEMLIDKHLLRQALLRASALVSDKFRGARLTLDNNTLGIETHNPENETSLEDLPVEYQGEVITIGFNIGYLLDIIGAMGTDTMRILLRDADSSALILPQPDDESLKLKYVLMPMKL